MVDAFNDLNDTQLQDLLLEHGKLDTGNRDTMIKRLMKNKNHFLFGYFGNKRNEYEYIYEKFKLLNGDDIKTHTIDTIYEPFCGTAAFSYILSIRFPRRYKYILNDNNKKLIELYNVIKNGNLMELINECNTLMIDIDKPKYLKIIKTDTLAAYIIRNKVYCIRPGLFPINFKGCDFKYMLECPIVKFLQTEDVIITNNSISEIDNEYNKNNIFVFIDPPYLSLNNDWYSETGVNIYEYFFNNNINKFDCKILLILNDNWIIKLLFKDYIKTTYGKTYETTKKKINHLVITNY